MSAHEGHHGGGDSEAAGSTGLELYTGVAHILVSKQEACYKISKPPGHFLIRHLALHTLPTPNCLHKTSTVPGGGGARL